MLGAAECSFAARRPPARGWSLRYNEIVDQHSESVRYAARQVRAADLAQRLVGSFTRTLRSIHGAVRLKLLRPSLWECR